MFFNHSYPLLCASPIKHTLTCRFLPRWVKLIHRCLSLSLYHSQLLQDSLEYSENSDAPLKRKSPYILKRQVGHNAKSRRPYILKRSTVY
uniref:Neurotensin/neuromedin N n=1 Tax=Nothobranchius furzeri TaxID=105023 RepID=A0A8C6L2A1_NOTFU